MSKISDELRKFTNTYDLNSLQIYELKHIADCIDSELMELPRDRDGVPIHVGDTVYLDDGSKAVVTCIKIERGSHGDEFKLLDESFSRLPNYLTHERPDSWKRIADELEEWSEDNRVNGDGEVFERARQFSDRIRKLAERED
jgi:hypothetical protein